MFAAAGVCCRVRYDVGLDRSRDRSRCGLLRCVEGSPGAGSMCELKVLSFQRQPEACSRPGKGRRRMRCRGSKLFVHRLLLCNSVYDSGFEWSE